MKAKVSIHDIAEAAGVSRGTVSRAFNERSDINADTRRRVLDAARELNYLPNAHARGLAKGKTEALGLLVPTLRNPYMSEIVTELEAEAADRGYSALLAMTNWKIERQEHLLMRLASGQVDGIVTIPVETPDSIKTLNWINHRVPVVSLFDHEDLEGDSVSFCQRTTVRLMIDHLAELGHERIAYLCPRNKHWTIHRRLDAYEACMASHGFDYRRVSEIPDHAPATMAEIIGDLTRAPAATAVVAFDDMIAISLINALDKHGLRVPQDISVTGVGNVTFAELSRVPLTTTAVDFAALTARAIDLVLQALNTNDTRERNRVTLQPELALRQSTAPVS